MVSKRKWIQFFRYTLRLSIFLLKVQKSFYYVLPLCTLVSFIFNVYECVSKIWDHFFEINIIKTSCFISYDIEFPKSINLKNVDSFFSFMTLEYGPLNFYRTSQYSFSSTLHTFSWISNNTDSLFITCDTIANRQFNIDRISYWKQPL